MSRDYIKPQLLNYLRANPGWHAKGDIERMEWRNHRGQLATPENVGRRLRELQNDKLVFVDLRKNHAWYSAAAVSPKPRQIVEQLPDGSVRVSYV